MKNFKNFVTVFFILIAGHTLKAQDHKAKSGSSGGTCFTGNSNVLNLGVGFFGGSYYKYGKNGSYKYSVSPAFSASFEHGLPEKIGPGYIGIGFYLGYRTATYRFDDFYYLNNRYYYEHKWTYSFWAIRGVYHVEELMTDNAELYFGSNLGIRYVKYSYNTNSIDPFANNYKLNEASIRPSLSLFAGGRYYFTKNIGAFLEIGYGITWLTGGLAFKF